MLNLVLNQLNERVVVGSSGSTGVDDKIGVLEANLGTTDLVTLESELMVDNPASRFLFAPEFLANIERRVGKDTAGRGHWLNFLFLGDPGLSNIGGEFGIAAKETESGLENYEIGLGFERRCLIGPIGIRFGDGRSFASIKIEGFDSD